MRSGFIGKTLSKLGMSTLTNNTERILKVWFESGRIFIRTDSGCTFSRPLEAFPLLKDASGDQRMRYEIGLEGDDIHWAELDEDIHISSFYESAEPDPENEIAAIFRRFPQLNVSEMARTIGINKALLAKYIYGIKHPSPARREQILAAIRTLGREMAEL